MPVLRSHPPSRTWRQVAAAIAMTVAVTATGTATSSAGPAPAEPERHCVVEVTSTEGGVLRTGPETCFDTTGEAAAHAAARSETRSPDTSSTADGTSIPDPAQLVANTIGWHFTGASYTGSSIQIVGTTCGGGVWYATSAWDNNIESSYHLCGAAPTTFYDYSNCSGTAKAIYSAASSLYTMNDRTSCVRYG